MIFNAEGTKKKTGYPGVNKTTLAKARTLFLTEQDFVFADTDAFEDRDQWISDIQQENIFALRELSQVDDDSEETTYNKSLQDYEYRTKSGKYRYTLRTIYTKQYHDHIEQLSGMDLRAFIADINNNIAGNLSGSNVRGMDVELMNVEKKKFASTGTEWTVIRLVLSDNTEFNKVSKMTWNPNNINLVHIDITQDSQTSTSLTVSIVDDVFGISVGGMLLTDFSISDNAGGINLSAIEETECGTYKLTASGSLTYGTLTAANDRFFGLLSYIVLQNTVILNNFEYDTQTLFSADVRYSGDLSIYTGLELADFTMVDDTNGAVTILSVTEGTLPGPGGHPNGRYEFTTTTNLTAGDISVDDGAVTGTSTYDVEIDVEAVNFSDDTNSNEIEFDLQTVYNSTPVTGLAQSAFTITDNENGSLTISSFSEVSAARYKLTVNNAAYTSGTVTVNQSLYGGSFTYDKGTVILRNTGATGTTDWINPDADGVPKYITVTRSSTNEVTTPTATGYTGNTLLVKQKTVSLPVNISMYANTFKLGTQYQLKFYYVISNSGTGSDRFVTIRISDDKGTVLSESFEEKPTSRASYTSGTFTLTSTANLLVTFGWNRYDMILRLDELEIIEV